MDAYLQTLTELGLKEAEAAIYLACLKLGQASVGRISEASGIQRTFAYPILRRLKESGLVSAVEIRGKWMYSALPIERFRDLHEERVQRLTRLLPELKALEKTPSERPKVLFYEGREGIFAAQRETLSMPRGGEILAYATAEGLYANDPGFAMRYIRERVKRGIWSRALAADTPETKRYLALDERHLRRTRTVPADKFPFSNEINIWEDKVSIMSMQGELMAVIIESESIARTQRSIFELAWDGAEKYQRAGEKTKVR